MNNKAMLEDEKNSGEASGILEFDNFLPKFLIHDLDNLKLEDDSDSGDGKDAKLSGFNACEVAKVKDNWGNPNIKSVNSHGRSLNYMGKVNQDSGKSYTSDFYPLHVSI